jgi:hypothetical protein
MAGLNQVRGSTQIIPGTTPASAMNAQFAASGGDLFVDKESHTAQTNGSQLGFTLAHMPVTGSEYVFLRGVLRTDGYTMAGGGQVVQFSVAPGTTLEHDDLVISYRKLIS